MKEKNIFYSEVYKASEITCFNYDEYHKKYENTLDLLYNMDRIGNKITRYYNLYDKKNYYVLSVLVNIQKIFKASLILVNEGAVDTVNILVRSMYEMIFNARAVLNNKNNLKILDKKSFKDGLGLIKVTEELKAYDLISIEDLNNYKNKCNEELKKLDKVENYSVEGFAIKANLHKQYIYYKLLSTNTHGGIAFITDNLAKTKNNYLADFSDFEEPNDVIFKLIECMDYLYSEILKKLNNNVLSIPYNNLILEAHKIFDVSPI